jgi:hypothetical protein
VFHPLAARYCWINSRSRLAGSREGSSVVVCASVGLRTSPLVARRDPLGVGRKPGDEPVPPRRSGVPVSRPTARRS